MIRNISLRIYETQIGILSLELANETYDKLDDIIKINDFGKRIYPQYLDAAKGIEGTKESFLANRIEFILNGKYSHELYDDTCTFRKKHIVLARFISTLLGEHIFSCKQESDKYTIYPTIDDRMYVVCWFGSDADAYRFRQKHLGGKYAYESSSEWYRYIFHDGKSPNCQHDKMRQRLIENNTYERWADYGTLYGISRYGLVCVSDHSGFSNNVLAIHMRKQYAQMAVLLLSQRASILRFLQKVSDISNQIKKVETGQESPKEMKEITKTVAKLHADYIRFVNRMWFTEITPQAGNRNVRNSNYQHAP